MPLQFEKYFLQIQKSYTEILKKQKKKKAL